MGQPVVSWLEHHARRGPDRPALVDLHRGRALTYGEFARRVRSVAWSLAERHAIRAGDRVAVLSRNDARVFEVVYACALLGAIVVPLNWRLTAAELIDVARDAEPAMLVHESASGAVAADVAGAGGVPAAVGWASEHGEPDGYEVLASAAVPPWWSPAPVDEDSVWMIIYTSGTTGLPKGVQATHRGVLASMHGILVAHRVGAESRCLTVLPTFHVAGLNLFANPVLYAGGTVLVARAFDPAQTLDLLTDTSTPVTHFCGVPASYQFMEQLPGFADAPLRPFVAVVGGAPVPSALVEAWGRRGVALTTVFGITEAGACVTAMPPGQELSHNGTIGLPLLYARCRVHTAEGRPAAPGQPGELQVSGALVTPGYWRNPTATAEAFTADGWLRTGDVASVTGDGHLVLVDRWKDMYISGGENVYPAEVENALHAHPAVSQAAVVGAAHPRWGEAGVAFVVLARGATAEPDQLRAWCRERLAAYKVPVRVLVVEDLPRNATGKILKGPLRESARGQG
ncbi:AMP-binding protein [Frankia sp. AgB1.9]|uniref:AMP-binding protein n=1 Tax=unclassified Frankia TaxID=2632575 RepID=UPI0019323187|nr:MULTISPECIES: AMP-binding protein [unclassified Frankia]MBL7487671.1 AMP-binding protein [Frankia sp. AgW1.1]MBL7550049.1 AMP-binding protein [Frankia sp. AgB1.9]MBL7621756.1 AMP-binding protein [Frankia sp. AgB1.8]